MVLVQIPIQLNENQISYYMDKRIKDRLDNKVIPSLKKNDKDYVIAIDGQEGVGKSYFAFQVGKYVDPSLNLSRVTFNAEEFRQAIFKAKPFQCVIFDEAFTGLSSRASLSGINKILISLMMQMRQKNLFVIIVLPSFFLLDKYVALFRTRVLIHIYENKGKRG
jgi:ABC-type antimicrobial peptide transport system ATPase subunit